MGGPAEHWRPLGSLDVGGLRVAVARAHALPADQAAPELLRIARAAQSASEFGLRTELLSAVERLAPDDLDLAVEQAVDAARDGDTERADALAHRVLATADVPAVLRGRALLALGTAEAWHGGSGPKLRAHGLLGEAAAVLEECGEQEWAAAALVTLAMKVCYLNGDLDSAVEQVRRALAIQPAPSRFRGVTLSFLGDALATVGQTGPAEEAAAEANRIGRRFGDHRVMAYGAWASAYAAAVRRDTVALQESLHEVERHPGDWYDSPTGAEFLASAADLLGRLGAAEALEWLTRAEAAAERAGFPDIAWLARAAHEARTGDPELAERLLARLPDSEEVPPREHWRILLLRAMAASRRGDPAADEFLARARAAAQRLGHPELPDLHEPVVMTRLSGAGDGGDGRASVRLLGGFAVMRGGRAVDIDAGQSRGLVAYLALGGGERSVDEVVEALWPDGDPAVTRGRLRNLLHRLRDGAGELVVRDGDRLRLAADVDLVEFERTARRALAASDGDRPHLATTALAHYGGELLPADRYAEWSVAARERVHRLHLALLDVAARARAEQGRLDEALGLVDLAIEAEPLDEARYRRAADLARRLGNEATARSYDARAIDVRRQLAL